MSGQNYYFLTALPALGELGSEPPITPQAMLEMLEPAPRARAMVAAVFLSDDLQLQQAVLSGEVEPEQAEPIVLTGEQVRDEAPLPPELAGEDEADEDEAENAQFGADRAYARYFAHAAKTARGSEMLTEWVRYEVGLRNALAVARAKALGIDAERYLVAPGLGYPQDDYAATLSEWSAAGDPLAGARVLDAARWEWIAEHSVRYSFSDDELAAYAARLVILHRWKRIAAAEHAQANQAGQNGRDTQN